MPTADLAACARAMREEEEALHIGWNEHTDWVRRWGQTFDEPHLFTGTRNECSAFIDQRAFAAGLRVLAAAEPTEAMLARTKVIETATVISIFRAMLGALLAGGDDADVA